LPVEVAPATHPALRDLHRADVRILLAEDNITNQLVALGILQRLGLRADVVASGREAVEALRKVPYDLVLMDVQMPEMDGLEATRAVRAAGSETLDAAVPIIAMTAHAMPGDRKLCLDAGMDDYIAKPVTPIALSALLEKWLAKLAPRAASQLPGSVQAAAPSTAVGAGATVFDEAALIDRSVGDRSLAQAIARSFLADVSGRIASMKSHLAAGEVHTVQPQAHTIKGAAAAVGGETVFALALALETSGARGDLGASRAGLEALAGEFGRLRLAMEASSLLTTP
jgi:CheY-like chemotaxis protein